jgi:GTP-binding protein
VIRSGASGAGILLGKRPRERYKAQVSDSKATLVKQAEFSAGATTSASFPPPVSAELAFAGRSNVGKSSLLNSLLSRRNLVRTSSTPGCTRQVNFLAVELGDGVRITLVDLPGYGYAKRSKSERRAWANLIESYLLERPTLMGVVLLVDVRRGLEEDDRELLEMLASPARTSRRPLDVVVVATKLDKVAASKRKLAEEVLNKSTRLRVIGYSAKDGTGREALWRKLRRMVGIDAPSE